jgi:hypothetical protein
MTTNLIKVCEVRARETETVAVQLAKNQYGHKVIINMIEVHSAIHLKGLSHEKDVKNLANLLEAPNSSYFKKCIYWGLCQFALA